MLLSNSTIWVAESSTEVSKALQPKVKSRITLKRQTKYVYLTTLLKKPPPNQNTHNKSTQKDTFGVRPYYKND